MLGNIFKLLGAPRSTRVRIQQPFTTKQELVQNQPDPSLDVKQGDHESGFLWPNLSQVMHDAAV